MCVAVLWKKDIPNQSPNSLKRVIKRYEVNISDHEDKVSNSDSYIPDWDDKDEREQKGLIGHWQKEIRNFRQSIDDRVHDWRIGVIMMDEAIKYIISRVVDNANDAIAEVKENPQDDFYKGKKLAYYEVLDTIKNELKVRDQNLKDFGLDIDLEKQFYN